MGGFYELAIELGQPSNQRLLDALKALWHHPSLEGCYLDWKREPKEQQRVLISEASLESTHLYGLAHLPNGFQVACGSCVVREPDGFDWLDFYVPTGALGDAYEIGGYPFELVGGVAYQQWQVHIDEWLRRIAEQVYKNAPYRLALIGFEVSGATSAEEIARNGIPAHREIGYLWPEEHHLRWYSPTI